MHYRELDLNSVNLFHCFSTDFKERTRILNAVTFCIFIFYNKSAFFI